MIKSKAQSTLTTKIVNEARETSPNTHICISKTRQQRNPQATVPITSLLTTQARLTTIQDSSLKTVIPGLRLSKRDNLLPSWSQQTQPTKCGRFRLTISRFGALWVIIAFTIRHSQRVIIASSLGYPSRLDCLIKPHRCAQVTHRLEGVFAFDVMHGAHNGGSIGRPVPAHHCLQILPPPYIYLLDKNLSDRNRH